MCSVNVARLHNTGSPECLLSPYHLEIGKQKYCLRQHVVLHRTNVPGAIASSVIASSVIASSVIPSSAIPSSEIPSQVMPSGMIPRNVIPSGAIPSSAIHNSATPIRAIPRCETPSLVAVNLQLFGLHILNSFRLG